MSEPEADIPGEPATPFGARSTPSWSCPSEIMLTVPSLAGQGTVRSSATGTRRCFSFTSSSLQLFARREDHVFSVVFPAGHSHFFGVERCWAPADRPAPVVDAGRGAERLAVQGSDHGILAFISCFLQSVSWLEFGRTMRDPGQLPFFLVPPSKS